MSKLAVITSNSQLSKTAQPGKTTPEGSLSWIKLSIIFCVALTARIWFNFATNHNNIAFSCDAAEYLRNAQALLSIIQLPYQFWNEAGSVFLGSASSETATLVRSTLESLKDLFISGPIFPLYLLSSYVFTGTTCDIANWTAPVLVQSFLSASTCLLIAQIGCRCWDKQIGFLAGIVSAFYPAFILNSGRLYSESFACFLLCLTTWLTVRTLIGKQNSPWALLLTGFTMLCLQLTRSIMFVLSLALIPITYFGNRKRHPWLALCLLVAGAAIIALPWLCLQQIAFGKSSLIVDRVGHYNFFVGNNVDTQGWLSYPYPNCNKLEKKSFIQIARESIKTSPSRFVKLMLDKPVRFFKFPWNDFRTSIGPTKDYTQILLHQIILLFAGLGIPLGIFLPASFSANGKQVTRARIFLLGLLLFQCIYMAFITVPRYNLTAMPFVILFAAAGAIFLARLIGQHNKAAWQLAALALITFQLQRTDLLPFLLEMVGPENITFALAITIILKSAALVALAWTVWCVAKQTNGNLLTAKLTIIALTLAVFPSLCLPLRAHGRWYEWQCPLSAKGEHITQKIDLPVSKLSELASRQCYLMIQSNGAQELNNGITIAVNGKPVEPVLIPNLPFLESLTHFAKQGKSNLYLECEYIFECLTYAAGISNLDLRQWFLIPIPPSIFKNQIAGQPLTVEIKKTEQSLTTLYGAYRKDKSHKDIPDPALYSWEKAFYGVESEHGFTDTSLDTRIDSASTMRDRKDLSNLPGLQTGDYYIRLLVAPASIKKANNYVTAIAHYELNKDCLTDYHHKALSIKVNSLPAYSSSDSWLVRISGTAQSNKTPLAASIRIIANGIERTGTKSQYDSPWSPRRITATGNRAQFNLALPLIPSAMPGQLQDITISMQASEAPQARSADLNQYLRFQNVSMDIYRLPSLPMSPGHYIL